MHCFCGFLFEICKNRLCSNEFEEAAKKWVFETNGHKWSNNDNTAGDNYGSFVQGLKWKEERSYSYEEVILFLQKYRLDLSSNQTERWGDTTEHWFQKYKKR